jgi:hypothetical protein
VFGLRKTALVKEVLLQIVNSIASGKQALALLGHAMLVLKEVHEYARHFSDVRDIPPEIIVVYFASNTTL